MDMRIFAPIKIKSMELKNRIGMPPFLNNPVGKNGFVNDLTIRWFEERAKGGAGFIMTGAVDPRQDCWQRHGAGLAIWDDQYIPGFTRLAETMHRHGAKLGVQIAFLGPGFGQAGMSPSPWPDEKHAKDTVAQVFGLGTSVGAVSIEDIQRYEEDAVRAAMRLKAAGVDCVELHCAHGGATLCNCAISPYYNRRTDKYGGSWENRLRLPVETIQKMRTALGSDYPILVRISADELLGEQGITLEDTTSHIVPALEKAGVDCFDVSQGSILHSPQGIILPLYYPRGCFIHHSEAVKKATSRPVIGVGRIVDLDIANQYIEQGKADIIYMGGQLSADPETPRKYIEGRADDIRLCIGCRVGCGRPCAVNYDIQDNPIPMEPAKKTKRVLVIGGGVGGMEASRVAALRGHQVTLVEKSAELGGMVAALARNSYLAEFGSFVRYLVTQMRKLKIDVRVCKEGIANDVKALKPDVVILASGSSMVIPDIAQKKPGVINIIDALNKPQQIGQRVVIWGLVAATMAIWLADQGKEVTMIGRGGEETLDRDDPNYRRVWVFRKLTDVNLPRETKEAQRIRNPRVFYHVDVEEVMPEGIRITDKDGAHFTLPYDTFIISRERLPDDALYKQLQGMVPEIYQVGDCRKVGDIKEAVWSANEIARKI